MRKLLAAAMLMSAASAGAIAYAQVIEPMGPPAAMAAPDARSLASDQEVGEARRAYRAACNRHESAGFCECVTAGVAQALMPEEVRIAARTIGARLPAQGDTTLASDTDIAPPGSSSAARIEQVEGHYAEACAQFRD